ncbi:MAG: diguanylate cyclase, partial [bacterium]|nr:diguanylate cyclase [bacterium]
MSSFRRKLVLTMAGFVLLLALGAFSQLTAPVVTGLLESLSEVGDGSGPAESTVRAVMAAVVLIAGLVLALVTLKGVNSGWHSDLSRLRAAIRQLATSDQELPTGMSAFEELQACHTDLAEVSQVLRKQQARLNEDASRDPLTGLPNRRTFDYTLAHEMAVAQRTGWPVSLIMVDLDHFKVLNDTFGHQAGDFVLQRVARRLASLIRQADIVARIGGEEFVIILPGTDQREATHIAQQLRNALRCDQMTFEQQDLQVTASFGVAGSSGASDSDAMVQQADRALYEAKENGRDTVATAPAEAVVPAQSTGANIQLHHADDDSAEVDEGSPVDRDTMALMGSMFSILQVIPDQHRVSQDLLQQVAAVLQCSTAVLLLFDESSNKLVTACSLETGGAGVADADEPSFDLQVWFAERRDAAAGRSNTCISPTLVDASDDGPPSTLVRMPLGVYGEVFGAIEAVVDTDSDQVSHRQQSVLAALGTIGATALRNCGEHEMVEEAWIALTEVLCQTIHSRDAYKRDHAERVSHIALELARAMGQTDSGQLQLVRLAGLVHDIGKVGLPPKLCDRRGRLRPAERKLLEEHCAAGAKMLER